LAALFIRLARRMQSSDKPRGRLWNMFEAVLIYLRDQVARPAIGDHDGDKYVPLLWTIFLFILGMNLMGMVPWVGAPTSAFAVTLGMAAVTFITGIVMGSIKFGPIGFWTNQVPGMDLPWYMAIVLKPFIWVIEVLGMCIKHGVLGVRLLANMVAGHLVLLGVMSIAFSLEGAASNTWWIAAPISVLGAAALSLLELFVAFLQAYIFTFLSALFIGAAVHHH
jgi:F-type H+-transporting ATPase subunit a